ncbi:MAG: nuclear transport factor 2 family protein [Bacteroidota bacterium]
MTHLEKIQDMYRMIGEGKTMDAFEKYYHDDVTVIDGTAAPRNGKAEQRKAIQEWYGMIKEFHGSGVSAITADEENGITSVESWTDITFQDGNRVKMEEVGLQRWSGDQIIHERFYYSRPNLGGEA